MRIFNLYVYDDERKMTENGTLFTVIAPSELPKDERDDFIKVFFAKHANLLGIDDVEMRVEDALVHLPYANNYMRFARLEAVDTFVELF